MPERTSMVREYATRHEAELACGLLASLGIEAWLADRSVLGTGWLNPGRNGGIVLQVNSEDAEQVHQILSSAEHSYSPVIPPTAAHQQHEPCPACGSPHKEYERRRALTALLAVLFKGHPNPFRVFATARWKCSQCDHRWPAS